MSQLTPQPLPENQASSPEAARPVAENAPQTPPEKNKPLPGWIPQPIQNAINSFSRVNENWRNSTLRVTPAFVVNNSTNILGASHVATEMLMFKSGMKGGKLIDDPSKPLNWIVQPLEKIKRDIYGGAKARDFSLAEIFHGNPIKNFHRLMMDTHSASMREVDRQIATNAELVAAGKQAKRLSLGNPWQTRTTGLGLAIFTLMAFLPDKKETDQEIEDMAKMRTLHPMSYIGERLRQAVWVPGWPRHKREMQGIGYLGIGIFSMLGSWRNRGKLNPAIVEDAELLAKGLTQGYRFNFAYFLTGMVSFISGLPLLFSLDERKAFETYGSMVYARLPLLPFSIGDKVWKREEGWQYYLTGKLTFQIEDMLFNLIGGATKKKNPDGTYSIVDHEKIKKQAIAEAKEEKKEIREEKKEMQGAEPQSALGSAPEKNLAEEKPQAQTASRPTTKISNPHKLATASRPMEMSEAATLRS